MGRDIYWIPAPSIALGIFLHNKGYKTWGLVFLVLGIGLLVAGVIYLVAVLLGRHIQALGPTLQRFTEGTLPVLRFLRFLAPLIMALLPVLVGFVTYRSPLYQWYTSHLKYPDAYKAYKAGRERYLEFTVDSFRDAESYFRAALSNQPTYAEAQAGLGELYSAWSSLAWYHGEGSQSFITKAMEHSLSAISLDPRIFESHRSLAAALSVSGSPTLAVKEAEQALTLKPKDREAKFWKWVAEGERYDTAYFTAVENDPSYDFVVGLVRIGFALKRSRPNDARKFFERAQLLAHTRGKDIPLIYVGIGDTYVNQAATATGSRTNQALETAFQNYRKAVELDDRLIIAHANWGDAYMTQEKWADAVGEFDRALQFKPNYQIALYNKATSHYELGNLPQAKQAWRDTAALLVPDFPLAKFALALWSYHQGQIGEAVAAYRDAVNAGHNVDPQEHFDSPDWCKQVRLLGPKGLIVVQELLNNSGIPAH